MSVASPAASPAASPLTCTSGPSATSQATAATPREPAGVSIASGLCLNPSWPTHTSGEAANLQELANQVQVILHLNRAALDRLFALWKTLTEINADEIGDWAFEATVSVTATAPIAVPTVRSLLATVYTDGDVLVGVAFEGIDSALWLIERVDLNDMDSLRLGPRP
jgi:hypothetical protein